jgi:3-mercaptopyruvate sulfurtransferase SseA
MIVGCKSGPTKIMEESVNVFADNIVLVDTHSSFYFSSYHLKGSVNLVTTDFLILKNPRTKRRILDPDLNQTIERLAKRGISPTRRVVLLSDKAQSVESKKWRWLLKNLEVENVTIMTIAEFKKSAQFKEYSDPQPEPVWALRSSADMQKEFILKKSKICFLNWNEKKCN